MNRKTAVFRAGLIMAWGFLASAMFFPLPARPENSHPGHVPKADATAEVEYWTCGMHPSVKISPAQYEKGSVKCPICSMDLIPVYRASAPEAGVGREEGEPPPLTLSKRAQRLAGIETWPVERIPLFKEIYTVGTITYDEGNVALVSAWVGGRIDRLYVDFTGVTVKKGEPLVWIYSPQLITAQEEYLLSRKAARAQESGYPGAEELLTSSRRKLRRLGLTEKQIAILDREEKVQDHITVYAPLGGTVIEKKAREGMYVKEGEPIYLLADLSRLWVMVDIYEYELGWVRLYQEVEITVPAFPGEVFRGKIAFIEPFLDPATRTAKVRVNLPNPENRFKPEMYVNARIRVPLSEFGLNLDPGIGRKYICPMHPEVVSETAGNCPECGMRLVAASPAPENGAPGLAIPKSAVLETGRRNIVWVEDGEGRYRAAAVTLGPQASAEMAGRDEPYYPVLDGLKEGERVVTRGNFLLDSQSQLRGAVAAAYGGALAGEKTPDRPPGHQH